MRSFEQSIARPEASRGTERAPRILHIAPALFGPDGVVGGAERYAYELARYMARKTPTRLVTFGDRSREERADGLSIRVIGRPWYVRGQRSNPLALRLIGELRNADIVHCHQRFVLASSLAALFCRATGRRVYVTNLGGGGWDVSRYLATDRWFDAHLHLSDYSRRGYGHNGDANAHVIFAGVDDTKFSPAPHPRRRDRVLFVGRIAAHKGIDILLDAMPPETTLEVIGHEIDQRYLDVLRQRARGRRVLFRHTCTDQQLVEAYRRALCVVLPSVYRTMYGDEVQASELLGQTLLEGMACGAPAICTAVGGMPEVVVDRITGFVVPPSDPEAINERIRWIRDNPAKAALMGAAGRRLVQDRFTWPGVVQRCLTIYRMAA